MRNRKSLWRYSAGAASILVLIAALDSAGQEPETRIAVDSQMKRTIIGPDDTISITALNCEEISKSWRVSTSGELNLPLAGRIQAGGMTVEQLEQEVTMRLAKYLREPQVSLFVTEFRSQPVTVTGAVDKPGTLQLGGSRTLFEVLVMAGGPKEAGPTVTIKRGTDHGPLNVPGSRMDTDGTYRFADVDLTEVMTGRGDLANIHVEPYDVITVSHVKTARMVQISGEVYRPGSVELVVQDTVSLKKVLAVAGGLTSDANGGKTMIVHISPEGLQTSAAVVDVPKIMAGKAKDLELMNGDIVIVPTSGWKVAMKTASTSAITGGVFTAVNILAKF